MNSPTFLPSHPSISHAYFASCPPFLLSLSPHIFSAHQSHRSHSHPLISFPFRALPLHFVASGNINQTQKIRIREIMFFIKVSKSDVDAALKVLNFAIYHKELTDMEDREQERERENERKRKAENDGNNSERVRRTRRDNNSALAGDGTETEGGATEAMEEDETPTNTEMNIFQERCVLANMSNIAKTSGPFRIREIMFFIKI